MPQNPPSVAGPHPYVAFTLEQPGNVSLRQIGRVGAQNRHAFKAADQRPGQRLAHPAAQVPGLLHPAGKRQFRPGRGRFVQVQFNRKPRRRPRRHVPDEGFMQPRGHIRAHAGSQTGFRLPGDGSAREEDH